MTNSLKDLACFLALLFIGAQVQAQRTDEKRLLTRLENHFLRMDSVVLLPDSKQIRNLSWNESLPTEAKMDAALTSLSMAKMKEHASVTGLKWTGQLYLRPDEELGLDDDEATVSHYKGKAQAEVRWDFLQSGLIRRKNFAEGVALEEAISRQEYGKTQYQQWAEAQKEALSAYYDALLAVVLSYRLQNLQLLGEIRNYMLANEMTGSELLLSLLNEKAESERRYEMLLPTSVAALEDALKEGPLYCTPPHYTQVKIDTLRLLEQVRESDRDVEILRLRMQLLDNKAQRSTYLSTTSLSPFVRYSRYFISRSATSRNLDVGLAFTLPLSNESKRHRQTLRSERDLLSLQLSEQRNRVEREVRAMTMEMVRLNRMIDGENRRLEEAKAYIEMRSKAYQRQYGDYNALARIKEYDNYFSYWEKLLNDYYQRDCLLIDLQEFLVGVAVETFAGASAMK